MRVGERIALPQNEKQRNRLPKTTQSTAENNAITYLHNKKQTSGAIRSPT
jgi:hypothetical protein